MDSKVAVITGATSGIGTAVAERFAVEGYAVILIGRNRENGESIESKFKERGFKTEFLQCDVSNDEEVLLLASNIKKTYARVDVLFNNAGIMLQSKEIESIPKDEWKKTFETNIDSVLFVTRSLKELIVKCKGCIINNASIAGLQSYVTGRSYAYSASKSAVIQFSRQMALNYAEAGVRVNCICPGIIDTPFLGDRNLEDYAKRIPLGYVGQPDDVANVVAFLASDQASYLTGVVLPVDGGVSL